MLFDGTCHFCRRWVGRWQSFTRSEVDYVPFQEVREQFPEITEEQFQASVQLIEADGTISSGAEAVFRALSYASGKGWMLWAYRRIPGFRPISEWLYRLVSNHRTLFSNLTRFFWGDHVQPSTYLFSRFLFLRGLGVLYFIAFISLAVQIQGLIGSNGILPVSDYLEMIEKRFGPERFLLIPTLSWIFRGDFFLAILCWGGAVLSVFMIIGLLPVLTAILLFVFYLSLTMAGQDFMSFQWDALLLEVGFLSIFFSSKRIFLQTPISNKSSRLMIWLFHWLLFRLVISSGLVKLLSGDYAWASLTALDYHYETQPLPTWIGWFVHQLPSWFQSVSVFLMFVVELAVPFFIFAPRRLRVGAAAVLVTFQFLILLTGNYCYFNLLAIGLCLLLIDDHFWPQSWKTKLLPERKMVMENWKTRLPKWIFTPFFVLILVLSSVALIRTSRLPIPIPRAFIELYRSLRPLHLVSSYGLFAVMTTRRSEIVLEGSTDGVEWSTYEFKYKPGDIKQRPIFVAPYQPRLDWQMWFAALSRSHRQVPWFLKLCIRLLQGSPEVLSLFKENPFPERPPRFIRAALYEYHFTDIKTLFENGEWWRRDRKGLFMPSVSLARSG